MLVDCSPRSSTSPSRAIRSALALAVTALTASCATSSTNRAAEPRAASESASAEPPATIEQALTELERAEGSFNQAIAVLSPMQDSAAGSPPSPSPTATRQPTEAAPTLEAPSSKVEPRTATQGAHQDPCSTACRALASMERATEHLCALAGDGDPRCENARSRVRGADERVRATCPACAPPG